MVTLTKVIGAVVRWITASRRRVIAAVAIPVFAGFALVGPSSERLGESVGGLSIGSSGQGGVGGSDRDDAPAPPTPTTVPIGPSNAPREHPDAPPAAAAVARSYALTVNSHDARPGQDKDFLDSYRRAKPYVTAELYDLLVQPSTRGNYQWAAWSAAQATVSVTVDRVAVADGAPVPTATTAHLRVTFTQVVTPRTGSVHSQAGSVALITTRQSDGRWLVSRLLAA